MKFEFGPHFNLQMYAMLRFVPLLVAIVLPVGFWGYAFEASYFLALDLSPHETLHVWHYFASGGKSLLVMIVLLVVYASLKKFFTSGIHVDDMKELKAEFSAPNFRDEVTGARLAVIFSTVFWSVVYFANHLPAFASVSNIFLYVVFVNVMMFLMSIASSPQHAKGTVLVVFVLSVAICFAAGGYGAAKQAMPVMPVMQGSSSLRDDHIVQILLVNGKLHVKSTELVLPGSWGEAVKRVLGAK